VNIEFAGNGADFPVLGVKVAANLHARFRADHEFLRKSQSNRIYAGELSGAEVETCWQQENIAGTETGRKQIS
jgi:hypothetical protein